MANSTQSSRSRKGVNVDSRPKKPYGDYPLMFHASGRIARKIKGKLHYFGRWGHRKDGRVVPVDDVEEACRVALEEFNRQWPYLSKGEAPPTVERTGEVCTLRDVCNAFWRQKRADMLAGDLSPRTFRQYEDASDLLIAHFGKDKRIDDIFPRDFQELRSSLAERYGVHGLKSAVTIIRMIFKFAWDHRRDILQDTGRTVPEAVDFGQSFKVPGKVRMRRARNEAGPRMFTADELRTLLDVLETGTEIEVEGQDKPLTISPDPALRAMVLLGINCGFGNTDCATLPQSAVDLESGWIDFPRPKTEIQRRIPLWPETVDALRKAIASRPRPDGREYAGHCFLTSRGNPWVRVQPHAKDPDKLVPVDALSQKFSKLLHKLNINGRQGLGFYTLRHNFQTIGGNSKDPDAVSSIMGHSDNSMAAVYRESIPDERLRDVVNVVHSWLFGNGGAA